MAGAMKLVVEVLHATDLPAKDGKGSSSPYVEVEFEGQRLRTKTLGKDLNPVWNETLEFNIANINALVTKDIHVSVYTSKGLSGQRALLGRATVEGHKLMQKDDSQPQRYALESGFLTFFKGKAEITLKAYYHGGARSVEMASKRVPTSANKVLVASAIEKAKSDGGGKNGTTGNATDAANYTVKETKVDRRNDRVKKNRHDLVTEVRYLFVRIDKARGLPAKDLTGKSDPYVEVKYGNAKCRTEVIPANLNPEWDEVFAISMENHKANYVEIIVKDKDMVMDDFIGCLNFDIEHIPKRYPPDSPLALQWYVLESRRRAAANVGSAAPNAAVSFAAPAATTKNGRGEIMLAVWEGNQTDEAFPRSKHSLHTPSSSGAPTEWHPSFRSAVYVAPRLWYLRLCLMEARDLFVKPPSVVPKIVASVELVGVGGKQQIFTTPAAVPATSTTMTWTWRPQQTTYFFVAAEPFNDQEVRVILTEKISDDKEEVVGGLRLRVAEQTNVERRSDHRVEPKAKWFVVEREIRNLKDMAIETLEKIAGNDSLQSRIRLSACLEGTYHVLDELTQYTSDVNPSDRRYGRSAMAVLELGIRSATGLLPMKVAGGANTANAYVVAKYGRKWIRTRTVPNSLAPAWHEQYVWDVCDPCTVLTVGVFHNCNLGGEVKKDTKLVPDVVIGKVRIRLSTLDGGRPYGNAYPLIALEPSGVKKRGEIELVVRLTSIQQVSLLLSYFKTVLPRAHYAAPMSIRNIEILRGAAMSVVEARLRRSDPPLPSVAVHYLLDTSQAAWSWRRIRANFYRITRILNHILVVWQWLEEVKSWRRPVTTLSVHILFFVLCLSPELILPTFFFYIFLIGLWKYRFRPLQPAHMDVKLSLADITWSHELEEEFDSGVPSKENRPEMLKIRYDRMKQYGARVQNIVGDVASQLERLEALLSWRDRRATAIFICFCFLAAIVLYVVPPFVITLVFGLYWLRHPKLRRHGGVPPPPVNFFRRLPPLSDTVF